MIYTASQFHLQYIAKYQLIVKANYIHDVIYVIDAEGNLLVYMKYESNSPTEEALKLLSLPFQHVYVSIPHSNLTFIPNDLYDMEDTENYQEFMDNPMRPAENVSLTYLQTQAYFQYDVLLEQRWKSIFPDAKFVPEFKLNLEQARPHIPLQGEVLGLVFNETAVDLFLFINGQFKFYNTFEIKTEEDLNYYVLNLFQVFGLQAKISKAVYSSLNSENPLIARLSNFAKHIVELKASTPLLISDEEVAGLAKDYITELPTCAL